ncbi:redox-regulated ATPase YchF [Candidatus Microgenomates bacterium]|nr:redox-regulated ATPase YchF [Candidatus Microgenomates bacterium]
MLQVGIVGLANVGKSTLFNALLKKQQALVANYPFATIEPNVGIVAVPDLRLQQLAEITKEEEKMEKIPPILPATVKFLDIAGLVKGAATGAGLGNKFLANIREVDLICHVVRDFSDNDIIREGSSIDPESDKATVNTELILADMETIGKQKVDIKTPADKKSALEKLQKGFNEGRLASEISFTDEEKVYVKEMQLLTFKPVLYVYNTKYDNGFSKDRLEIDARVEAELAGFSDEEQVELLKSYGMEEPGLNRLIQKAYEMLGLISYLTCGEKEVRAWTITKAFKAPQAAGVIHTDFEKNFIKAEVVSYDNFCQFRGWKKCREMGKARLEGKEYVVCDGDVIEFKVGV